MRRWLKDWRVLGALFAALLGMLMVLQASAAGLADGRSRVFDYAGQFNESEIQTLEEKAAQLREEMKAEIVVLTVEDAGGKSAADTADSFYFDNGFSESFHENGLVMLIDLDNRELYLGTYGSMIRILTDARIEAILDDVYAYASEGRYAEAALAGLAGAERDFNKGIASGQYNYDTETGRISVHRSIRWYEVLIALAISTAAAGGVCMNVIRQYGMQEEKGSNYNLAYRADSSFRFQDSADHLLNTSVTHIMIPKQTGNVSGGGGGHSTAGRSSTHSYGGHQAGGGGRKF